MNLDFTNASIITQLQRTNTAWCHLLKHLEPSPALTQNDIVSCFKLEGQVTDSDGLVGVVFVVKDEGDCGDRWQL